MAINLDDLNIKITGARLPYDNHWLTLLNLNISTHPSYVAAIIFNLFRPWLAAVAQSRNDAIAGMKIMNLRNFYPGYTVAPPFRGWVKIWARAVLIALSEEAFQEFHKF